MELTWGFILPNGEILEGSSAGEFPDHRRLVSEYFSAQGDPDTGDPESVALSAGWIAFTIDAGEIRLKLSRLPGEDAAWPLNNAVSAVELLQRRYQLSPVMVTVQMFTAAGIPESDVPDEPFDVPVVENPRRRRNAEYWASSAKIDSWGFVHPDDYKVVDGAPMRGVTSHEELAAKITRTRSGARAMAKMMSSGWLRYFAVDVGIGAEIAVEAETSERDDPEDLIDRVMVALRLVSRHVDRDPQEVTVDLYGEHRASIRGDSISHIRRQLESRLMPV